MKVSRRISRVVPLVIIMALTTGGCGGDDNPAAPQEKLVVFENNYGGASAERGFAVTVTSDGGYIVAGVSRPAAANENAYLVKVDRAGNLAWEKTYGGTEHDYFNSVVENADGGYTSGGSTASFGALSDFYLVRTDDAGNVVWERNFGGAGSEFGASMCAGTGGGYVITGSKDGDVYIMKVDNNGTFVWDKTFGGVNDDGGRSICAVSDGGYVIAGLTSSFGTGGYDVYLIRTDSDGDSLWTETFGGTGDEEGHAVSQTSDGGYIVTGTSGGLGSKDVYLVRTDLDGDFQWSKTFGGSKDDEGSSVVQTAEGGYIVTGVASDESSLSGATDLYLLKTNNIGQFQWERTFGGTSSDEGACVTQTSDGGYIITGLTSQGGSSGRDMYLIKTDANGDVD